VISESHHTALFFRAVNGIADCSYQQSYGE